MYAHLFVYAVQHFEVQERAFLTSNTVVLEFACRLHVMSWQWMVLIIILLILDVVAGPLLMLLGVFLSRDRIDAADKRFKQRWGILYGKQIPWLAPRLC